MDHSTEDLETRLRAGLAARAQDVPAAPDDLYERVLAGHRAARRRRTALAAVVAAALVAVAVPFVLGGGDRDSTASTSAPDACIDPAEATRDTIEGTPVWVRFCPGPEGFTAPAEVPSDALTTHLEVLAGLEELDAQEVVDPRWGGPAPRSCRPAGPTSCRSASPTARSRQSLGRPTPSAPGGWERPGGSAVPTRSACTEW